MALTTVQSVKVLLGIPASNTSEDDKLGMMLDAADRAIKKHVGLDIEETTYPGAAQNGSGDAGYYSGNDSQILLLKHRPLTAVSTIHLDNAGRFGDNPDGSFPASTLLTFGTDYVIVWDGCLPGTSTKCSYRGQIERVGGVWPAMWRYIAGSITPRQRGHQGNIKVAYTAGYATVPNEYVQACAELVAYLRVITPLGMRMQSESYEDYSYNLAQLADQGVLEIGSLRHLLSQEKEIYI